MSRSRTESSSSGDSETDLKKKMNDVFEGSVYWKFEQSRIEKTNSLNKNKAIKEARKR